MKYLLNSCPRHIQVATCGACRLRPSAARCEVKVGTEFRLQLKVEKGCHVTNGLQNI